MGDGGERKDHCGQRPPAVERGDRRRCAGRARDDGTFSAPTFTAPHSRSTAGRSIIVYGEIEVGRRGMDTAELFAINQVLARANLLSREEAELLYQFWLRPEKQNQIGEQRNRNKTHNFNKLTARRSARALGTEYGKQKISDGDRKAHV